MWPKTLKLCLDFMHSDFYSDCINMTTVTDLHDSGLCTFLVLRYKLLASVFFFSPCPISMSPVCPPSVIRAAQGHEWKGLKRCDKHFTVENQVWQASALFTSVLRIPTKSCGFFGKNTMTAAAFWSPLLSLNNPGSHRCYHFGSQKRNEEYEETNLVWLWYKFTFN